MNEEIKDESNEVGIQEKPAEAPQAEGLTNREALAKAISEKREVRPDGEAKQGPTPSAATPTKQEVKQAVEDYPEPPAEFSAAGKKAWIEKDILGIQKEYRRVHDGRTQEIARAQKAERDAIQSAKPIKDLVDRIKTYLAARGDDSAVDEAKLAEALQVVNALKATDRKKAKAELKAVGIDFDAEDAAPSADPEINNRVQKIENALLEKERQQEFAAVSQTFGHSIEQLAALKTRTGEPVFPGFQDSSEAGIQFARELGSLTRDSRFVNGVLRRFPDADHVVLVREAYKYLGGEVSGEPVKVSPNDTQKHIEKSRRAAASTPGRVVTRNESSNLAGKLSNRAALARALEESREH